VLAVAQPPPEQLLVLLELLEVEPQLTFLLVLVVVPLVVVET